MSRQFWWVNHKKTVRQELEGGYLWSPRTEKGGKRSQFYDNMRKALPGDLVLSFANAAVGAVGVVTDHAVPSIKPEEFRQINPDWSREGWYLPVNWRGLRTRIRPKTVIAELAPLLPSKYSPVNPHSGNGNEKAYLAQISESVFDLMIRGQEDVAARLSQLPASLVDPTVQLDDIAERTIELDQSLTDTEKEQLVLARRGQGRFRAQLIERYGKCIMTGVADPALLVASHIKPWRVGKDASERLDVNNGLLLSPHIDHLFDRGFLTFSDAGDLMISVAISPRDIERLGITSAMAATACGPFTDETKKYLRYHRDVVFVRPES